MAEGRPWPLHLLPRFLLLLSMAVCCASQARNVEVFFPSNSAPAFPNSPPVPPPPPPPPPSPPVSSSPPGPPGSPPGKTNVTVTKAVVATAASTFVVSGILFFAAFRYTFKRRKIESYSLGDAKIRRDGNAAGKSPRGGATNPYRASPAGGTLKAVVVDENGLEVLYWRDAGDARRRCNHCKQVIGGQGCDDDRGGRATAVPQKPPDGGRNGKSRQHASPLLQDDSLNSSDRLKEVISVVSEGSGGSESITLAPIVASPPLALPPGRRGSASKPPSPASSSSPRPAIVQHSSSSPPAAHQFSAVAAAAPPVQSSKAPAGPPPPPPPKPPSAAPPPPPPKPPSAAPPPPPPLLPLKGAAPPPPPAPPGKAAAPAPPPPPPGKGGAPPPPPPPVSGRAGKKPSPSPPPPPGLGSRKPPASRPGGQPPPEAPQGPKMKPLHWDKVNTVNTDHSMVWDKIHGGSFRFDDDLMVALFGNVAAGRKSPRGSPTSSSNPHKAMAGSAAAAPAQICLLDPRKSQNIAIVLRSLAVSRAEVLDSLLEGRGISADTLEKLSKLAPTKDEEDTILGFSGNPSSLADAESFLFHLLRAVPSAFSRVDAMLFQANYEPEVLHLKQSLKALELACAEMRKQGLFMRMLEAVLKAGNRMNAGTVRGNAQAFNLSSLRKLSDVKSTDGKTTLLHFVVESVVRSEGKRCVLNRNHSFSRSMSRSASGLSAAMREEKEVEYLTLGLPVVGGLSMEYANVKKAAAVEPEALLGTCASLSARVEKVKRVVSSCGDGNGGFAKEMGEFLERAETELKALTEEQGRVMELVKQTTEYYMLGSSQDRTAHPLQLFIIVKDFVGMVDQACVDIARNLQQKKRKPPPSSGGSGSGGEPPAPEKKAPTRFPNLPPRFLSDNSRSSTSGSDSDSEDDF